MYTSTFIDIKWGDDKFTDEESRGPERLKMLFTSHGC